MEKLAHSAVLIFGIGGVGGYVTEALARAGVGCLGIVDGIRYRRAISTGRSSRPARRWDRPKTEVMKERILSINPDCRVEAACCFYLPEDEEVCSRFRFAEYDYVIDAV